VRRPAVLASALLAPCVAGLLALLLTTPASRADVELTVDPGMVKGAAAARVTIVEFSDYQ
jgi:protein-disulfide isomerase